MRWIAVAAGVLLVASVLARSEEQAAEEESPLIYTLEVNGDPHPIEVGKLLTLPAQEGPLKVLLKVAPYRVFRAPGEFIIPAAQFRFPRGWHLERRDKRESWTLELSRFELEVWMGRGKRDAASVIERAIELMRGLVDKEYEDSSKVKVIRNDRPLRLAGHKVAGTTYYKDRDHRFGFVGTYYALRTGADTVLFGFSELRERGLDSEPSAEWKEMERWLQESLKVLPPTDK